MKTRVVRLRLRGAYGRGVARIPVAVPRGGLANVPLRPSREVVAAISPLYLAAAIPLSLVLLLSVIVVHPREDDEPPRSVVQVAEFESLVPPVPSVIEEPAREEIAPEPAVAEHRDTPVEPEPLVAQNPAPAPSAGPIEIEIDAVDPVMRALPAGATQARVAAVRVPVRENTRAGREVTVDASDAFDLVAAATSALPRASAPLPAVSMSGSVERPRFEGKAAGEAGEPTNFAAAIEPAEAPQVAALPESPESDRGGLGFDPVSGTGNGNSVGGSGGAIAGVPLEALAPCESLAREDELKLVLLRRVRAGGECHGDEGSYRFIETRNVNAFSMGVREAGARSLGNRCEELSRAIACVEGPRDGDLEF